MSIERKIVLVTRSTRLEELIAKHHTMAQAKFYVEHLGADFADYQREHDAYMTARRSIIEVLDGYGRYQVLERPFLTNFLFGEADIVLALGQDGLVANTMKYLNGQPLVGLNPDPSRYDGVLLPFAPNDLSSLLPDLLADKRSYKAVTMAKATLSDQQTLYAVNDLFIGPKSHTSARYEIQLGEQYEVHSSSGLIVSTGLGSTAWMKSIVTGARRIVGNEHGGKSDYHPMPWDADCLQFAVREPFPSKTSKANLVFGQVARADKLMLRSMMPENGVIFSDGIETDYLAFNAGTQAVIGVAERAGCLVI